MDTRCAACGIERPEGYAYINEERFCHSDNLPVSCYEMAVWAMQDEATAYYFEGLE